MGLSNGDLSAADVAAVVDRGNGFGFGGDGSFWIIVLFLFALMGGWNGNSGFGGNGVQQGFDQAAVMNGLGQINTSVSTGFANAEVAANARQIADMQSNFALQSQFSNCCCENRLAIANLSADIAREACADRASVTDALREVMTSNNAQTQRILDQMCQDKIDAKNEQIANLRQQMNMMQLTASQNAQTQAIIANNDLQTAALEQYLAPTPRPAYVVPNPNCCGQNYGCGCGIA